MGPKVLKFCNMRRWRFLKPSNFQKLYKLAQPFFHSPGISLKGLTMLLLSEYACLTIGMLLLQRTPDAVSSSAQHRGSVTGLRQTLHLAISTTKMLTLLYLQQLLWLCQGHLVQKEGGERLVYRVAPPFCPNQGFLVEPHRIDQRTVCLIMTELCRITEAFI